MITILSTRLIQGRGSMAVLEYCSSNIDSQRNKIEKESNSYKVANLAAAEPLKLSSQSTMESR